MDHMSISVNLCNICSVHMTNLFVTLSVHLPFISISFTTKIVFLLFTCRVLNSPFLSGFCTKSQNQTSTVFWHMPQPHQKLASYQRITIQLPTDYGLKIWCGLRLRTICMLSIASVSHYRRQLDVNRAHLAVHKHLTSFHQCFRCHTLRVLTPSTTRFVAACRSACMTRSPADADKPAWHVYRSVKVTKQYHSIC